MSLDVTLTLTATRKVSVFDANITHNLNKMAEEAGIYIYLWRPVGIKTAAELIEPLKVGVQKMKDDPGHFKQFDAENGWGTYEDFVPWVEKYIAACEENPDAEVSVGR